MDEPTQPRNTAVYHFLDERLCGRFMSAIPRPQLISNLRNDESLRNRNFPGFRISNTVPTTQQVITAFKREIVNRHNIDLATSLSVDWIRQHPTLAGIALETLAVHCDDPADAQLWIAEVHERLESQKRSDYFKALVHALRSKFPDEDVHIFVSIVSYGNDQEELRKLVEQELLNAVENPQETKDFLESKVAAAKAKIAELEKVGGDLERELHSEEARIGGLIESLLREDKEIETRLGTDEALARELSDQLDQMKAKLSEQQQVRDATEKLKRKVTDEVKLRREELSKAQANFEKRRSDNRRAIEHGNWPEFS